MPQIQARCGLSSTTTHRIMRTLVERGFLICVGKGEYRLGTAAITLSATSTHRDLLPAAARPHLRLLSRKIRACVHLGIWDDGMVTYLVKQGYGKDAVHSSEGSQLEGYCSAIGKILLSNLPDEEFDSYLTDGLFVPMTTNTITCPHHLRREIADVRVRGWSVDNEEVALGLRCVAVPIRDDQGNIIAAISISAMFDCDAANPQIHLPALSGAAASITRHLFPRR